MTPNQAMLRTLRARHISCLGRSCAIPYASLIFVSLGAKTRALLLKPLSFLLIALLLVFSADALFAAETSARQLVSSAQYIAVLTLSGTPKPKINDASLDLHVFRQRARARVDRVVAGELPAEILVTNQQDSVLGDGTYLAFLVHAGDHYVLSSAFSLRRIHEDRVFWFPSYVPLEQVITEIAQLRRQ